MTPIPEFIVELREKVGHQLLTVSTAGAFVFDAEGRVLLVRHAERLWTQPGGIVEPFETPADAAVRETWEETGLFIVLSRLVGVFGGADHHIVYRNRDELAPVTVLFEGEVVEGDLRPDHEEVLEARFFAPSEARALDLPPRKRRHLERALTRDAAPFFDAPTWTPPAPA